MVCLLNREKTYDNCRDVIARISLLRLFDDASRAVFLLILHLIMLTSVRLADSRQQGNTENRNRIARREWDPSAHSLERYCSQNGGELCEFSEGNQRS